MASRYGETYAAWQKNPEGFWAEAARDIERMRHLASGELDRPLGVVIQSLAEITVLAQKAGVPRHAFLDFMNQSVMGSTFSRYKTPAFVNLDFKVTFTPQLLRKDLDLGLDAGRRFEVPMPLAYAAGIWLENLAKPDVETEVSNTRNLPSGLVTMFERLALATSCASFTFDAAALLARSASSASLSIFIWCWRSAV